jgi:hypothetical protein
MNRGSSESIISATLLSEASSSKGCNQYLCPLSSLSGVCSLTTNTFSIDVHFLRLRQFSFNAIVLLPRYPPSDVMTILHSLSIRLATAEAENPAKTTECMALTFS